MREAPKGIHMKALSENMSGTWIGEQVKFNSKNGREGRSWVEHNVNSSKGGYYVVKGLVYAANEGWEIEKEAEKKKEEDTTAWKTMVSIESGKRVPSLVAANKDRYWSS